MAYPKAYLYDAKFDPVGQAGVVVGADVRPDLSQAFAHYLGCDVAVFSPWPKSIRTNVQFAVRVEPTPVRSSEKWRKPGGLMIVTQVGDPDDSNVGFVLLDGPITQAVPTTRYPIRDDPRIAQWGVRGTLLECNGDAFVRLRQPVAADVELVASRHSRAKENDVRFTLEAPVVTRVRGDYQVVARKGICRILHWD